jgi:hypothetical protein
MKLKKVLYRNVDLCTQETDTDYHSFKTKFTQDINSVEPAPLSQFMMDFTKVRTKLKLVRRDRSLTSEPREQHYKRLSDVKYQTISRIVNAKPKEKKV